jgi:hypothetical protein
MIEDDLEIDDRPRRRRKNQSWIGWAIAAAVLGGLGYLYWHGDLAKLFQGEQVVAALDAGMVAPDAEVIAEKPLEEGDALLRQSAPEVSRSPKIAKWLAAPNIVMRLAAAAQLVANGQSPRPVLDFIEVEGEPTVNEDLIVDPDAPKPKKGQKPKMIPSGRMYLSDASFARYDEITEILASKNASYFASTYKTLRPYFNSAFAQVAKPGERFDGVLIDAINHLLAVQVPEGPYEVEPRGAIYLFKDPGIESMSPAAKHLLRMGPKNARSIQSSLRRFAEAAGLKLVR